MKIIITISGGLVRDVERQDADEVEVEIHDYDIDNATEAELKETEQDKEGISFVRACW